MQFSESHLHPAAAEANSSKSADIKTCIDERFRKAPEAARGERMSRGISSLTGILSSHN
jgi:hypothetical protein